MKKRVIAIIIALLLSLLLVTVFVACDDNVEYFKIGVEFDSARGSVKLSPAPSKKGYAYGDEVTARIVPTEPYMFISAAIASEDTEIFPPVVTAEDGSAEITFTVNENSTLKVRLGLLKIVYDPTKGQVTADNDDPDIGDTVTLTFATHEAFMVSGITRNGVPVTTDTNQLQLTIDTATVVEVEYEGLPVPNSVFDSLKGNVKYEGTYFYDHSVDAYDGYRNIVTIFGQDTFIYQKETDRDTGELYGEFLYRNADGKLAATFRDIHNRIVDEISNTDDYAEYGNPFENVPNLSTADFIAIADNVFEMQNPTKGRAIALPITGYIESIASVRLVVSDGKVTKMTIVTDIIHDDPSDPESCYVSTYEFDVSNSDIEVPAKYTQPFPHLAEHDRLKSALDKAREAQTYKANVFQHEIDYMEPEGGETRPGYGDVERNVYITPTFGYTDFIKNSVGNNELPNGYKLDGTDEDPYVYPFEYDPITDKITLSDPFIEGADYFRPSYDASAFAVELFHYVGDNTFELDDGVLYKTEYGLYDLIAPSVAPFFMLLHERVFEYATNLRVVLNDDDTLRSIYFVYITYGISEERTVTYDFDWNDADSLGLDFEEADKTSKLDPFKGTFTDENGNTVVVDDFGFVINGIPAEVLSYTEESGATFTVNWEEQAGAPPIKLYINLYALNVLRVSDENSLLFWTLTRVTNGVITIPKNYQATWLFSDIEENKNYYIRIQTHAVFLNDYPLTLVSFDEHEGISAVDGDLSYIFVVETLEDEDTQTVEELLYCYIEYEIPGSNNGWVRAYAEKTDQGIGVEIPDEYIGVYTGTDYELVEHRVDITYNGIKIDGEDFTIMSYSQQDGFRGRYNGKNNVIVVFGGSSGQFNVNTLTVYIDRNSSYTLNRTYTIQGRYIGVWEPRTEHEEKNYSLVITETQIILNGEVFEGNDITYDDAVGRYAVEPTWTEFTVYLHYVIDRYSGGAVIYMYSNDDSILVSFEKVSDEPIFTAIPKRYVGTWEGTRTATGDKYRLEITSATIKLTITHADGQTEAHDIIVESVDMESADLVVDVTMEGEIYNLQLYKGPNDNLENDTVYFMSEYFSIYVSMHRVAE